MPKGRPRLGRNGNTYTPKRTAVYEHSIGWAWREAQGVKATGPVRVSIIVREKGGHPGDLDNYVKVVLDALNGLAWEDDKQVGVIYAAIERGPQSPGLVVTVSSEGE